MAAIVQVVGLYGESGTKIALTTQRYNTAIPSQRDPGLAYPCNIPPAGTLYRSCWMYTGLEVVGGTYSQLTNFRWFTSGTIKQDWGLGSGKVQVALRDSGDHGCPMGNYAPPTGVAGLYGYDIKHPQYGHPYYKDQTVACADADQYTSSNPLIFDSSVITPTSSSKVTKFVVTQLVIAPDTEFGEKPEITFGIRWTEI